SRGWSCPSLHRPPSAKAAPPAGRPPQTDQDSRAWSTADPGQFAWMRHDDARARAGRRARARRTTRADGRRRDPPAHVRSGAHPVVVGRDPSRVLGRAQRCGSPRGFPKLIRILGPGAPQILISLWSYAPRVTEPVRPETVVEREDLHDWRYVLGRLE